MAQRLEWPNAEGRRWEPDTRDNRSATRRAGWRPFAGPTGSTLLSCTGRGSRCSRLPRRPFISLLSTGWQDGQDALGFVVVSGHPVILLSCHPVGKSQQALRDLGSHVDHPTFLLIELLWSRMVLQARPNLSELRSAHPAGQILPERRRPWQMLVERADHCGPQIVARRIDEPLRGLIYPSHKLAVAQFAGLLARMEKLDPESHRVLGRLRKGPKLGQPFDYLASPTAHGSTFSCSATRRAGCHDCNRIARPVSQRRTVGLTARRSNHLKSYESPVSAHLENLVLEL